MLRQHDWLKEKMHNSSAIKGAAAYRSVQERNDSFDLTLFAGLGCGKHAETT